MKKNRRDLAVIGSQHFKSVKYMLSVPKLGSNLIPRNCSICFMTPFCGFLVLSSKLSFFLYKKQPCLQWGGFSANFPSVEMWESKALFLFYILCLSFLVPSQCNFLRCGLFVLSIYNSLHYIVLYPQNVWDKISSIYYLSI